MSYLGVPDVVVTIFAYLHIISAMGWLGAAILFVSTLTPATGKLSPASRLEFLATVVPKMSRYFLMVATSTIVFGPALLATIPDYSPYLYVGIATGLAAYLVMLFDVRLFGRISKMAQEMMAGGKTGNPPPEFLRLIREGRMSTILTVLLLVVTLMFMVYSGYPF